MEFLANINVKLICLLLLVFVIILYFIDEKVTKEVLDLQLQNNLLKQDLSNYLKKQDQLISSYEKSKKIIADLESGIKYKRDKYMIKMIKHEGRYCFNIISKNGSIIATSYNCYEFKSQATKQSKTLSANTGWKIKES
jgi:uncharacterized protein YegP (UPF0339 family)